MGRTTAAALLGITLVLAWPSGAQAATPFTDLWTLVCGGRAGEASISVCIPNAGELAALGGMYSRTWGDPTGQDPNSFIPIGDSGAVLQWLTIEIDPDPVVNLHFSVQAGPTPTRFTTPSSLLSFPTITDARAKASAGITITDVDGDGATAVGQLPGDRFYSANYNVTSNFALLIAGPVVAGKYATVTTSGGKDWAPIGAASSMISGFDFVLSPNDIAGVTSVFVVEPIPEPGALAGLAAGLVGLVGARLLRRK